MKKQFIITVKGLGSIVVMADSYQDVDLRFIEVEHIEENRKQTRQEYLEAEADALRKEAV